MKTSVVRALAILLLVSLLVAGIYFLVLGNYRNFKIGLSFKYPKNYFISNTKDSNLSQDFVLKDFFSDKSIHVYATKVEWITSTPAIPYSFPFSSAAKESYEVNNYESQAVNHHWQVFIHCNDWRQGVPCTSRRHTYETDGFGYRYSFETVNARELVPVIINSIQSEDLKYPIIPFQYVKFESFSKENKVELNIHNFNKFLEEKPYPIGNKK